MPMFDDLLGQPGAVGTLRRALETGRLHHAYRFEGPAGVGKEKAAFALAQALVCTTPPPAGHAFAACGRCSACVRSTTLSEDPPRVPRHPDVVLIERGLYPPEVLRRTRPETQDISVDQIRRLVLEHASFPPHEGRSRIFIVRRADELSTSAANALLKTLEEPLPATYFVLLTDRGTDMLPTIRSRTLPIRFAPLPEAILCSILIRCGVAPEAAQSAAELAGGSAELGLALADAKASETRSEFVESVLTAMRAPHLAAAVAVGETRTRDKDGLLRGLAALAARFAQDARGAVASAPHDAERSAEQYGVVVRAIREIERSGSPPLVLESMVERLRLSL